MRPIQTSRAFGSAVRRARKDQGLSQVELAARAGAGRPWLSELETGKHAAELGRALSVLSALNLPSRSFQSRAWAGRLSISARSLAAIADGVGCVDGPPRREADRQRRAPGKRCSSPSLRRGLPRRPDSDAVVGADATVRGSARR
ncbi:MAG: helix-turn-helix transcriptional regulator, partial [Actinomycetia bacterium]|nr:helix-turn-helix transcriptional regulator [Actinomycetes bacterium]